MIFYLCPFIIRDKRKAQQAKRTQAKAKRTQAKAKRTQKMSNPRGFMEPIWEQDKDAGYDFSDEAFAADNAYYSKYGGNACIVCMGGHYITNVNIKTTEDKAYSNTDDYYYEENDYYEEEEVYEDDTNDY